VTLSISGTGGANNQQYPSAVQPADGSTTKLLTYNGTSSAAALCYSGTYRLVYFSFGFEAINSASDRIDTLTDVLDYLNEATGPTATPVPPTFTPQPPTATKTPTPMGGSVLIVDDDAGKSYESYYTAAVANAGFSYTVHTVSSQGSPSVSTMQSYDAVVWFTGDDWSTTLTSTDINTLGNYLDADGRLFISGQDIGYDIRTNSFFGNYLRASYVKDDTNNYDLSGVSGSVMGGINVNIQGSGGADNQSYPSGISTTNGSNSIFIYSGGQDGSGGLSYSGSYRLVYLSFGFEAIDNSPDRTSVINAGLNFLLN